MAKRAAAGYRTFPKQVTVGDSIWRIVFVRKVRLVKNPENVMAATCAETQTIEIVYGLSRKELLETFLHEVMHAIEYEYDINIPHDVIYKMEPGLASFFAENIFELVPILSAG